MEAAARVGLLPVACRTSGLALARIAIFRVSPQSAGLSVDYGDSGAGTSTLKEPIELALHCAVKEGCELGGCEAQVRACGIFAVADGDYAVRKLCELDTVSASIASAGLLPRQRLG